MGFVTGVCDIKCDKIHFTHYGPCQRLFRSFKVCSALNTPPLVWVDSKSSPSPVWVQSKVAQNELRLWVQSESSPSWKKKQWIQVELRVHSDSKLNPSPVWAESKKKWIKVDTRKVSYIYRTHQMGKFWCMYMHSTHHHRLWTTLSFLQPFDLRVQGDCWEYRGCLESAVRFIETPTLWLPDMSDRPCYLLSPYLI